MPRHWEDIYLVRDKRSITSQGIRVCIKYNYIYVLCQIEINATTLGRYSFSWRHKESYLVRCMYMH
jgi:hypothetical protein